MFLGEFVPFWKCTVIPSYFYLASLVKVKKDELSYDTDRNFTVEIPHN